MSMFCYLILMINIFLPLHLCHALGACGVFFGPFSGVCRFVSVFLESSLQLISHIRSLRELFQVSCIAYF